LGQEGLKDRRCLWAHLSVPLKNSSPEAAYQVLEKAWFSWYQWWQPRFPKS
jgi:cyanosortase A-associated protein